MVLLEHPPKLVYDSFGKLVEVTINAEDFRAYLQGLLEEVDWEDLPTHLQDAVDLLLIDEVRGEKEAEKNIPIFDYTEEDFENDQEVVNEFPLKNTVLKYENPTDPVFETLQ